MDVFDTNNPFEKKNIPVCKESEVPLDSRFSVGNL